MPWAARTVLLLSMVLAGPASAGLVAQRLATADLARKAGDIIHVRVVDVRSGRDAAGLPATWVTVSVARSVKGRGGPQLTFKQFGVATPLADGTVTRRPGLVQYRPDDELVLFLHPESAAGFTSPVGLTQGVYRVSRVQGHARVRGAAGGPPQDLDAFLAEVTRLARE